MFGRGRPRIVAIRLATAVAAGALLSAVAVDAARAGCLGTRGCAYRAVQQIGSPDPLRFERIAGLALDAAGTLYVADAGTAQVAMFDATGTPLQRLLRFGTAPGDLAQPRALALAPDGTLTVADLASVKQYSLAGGLIRAWNVPGITDLSVGRDATTWTTNGTEVAAFSPLGVRTGQWHVGVPDSPAYPFSVSAGPSRVLVGAADSLLGGDIVISSRSSAGIYGLGLDATPAFTPSCQPADARQLDAHPLCAGGPVAAAPDGSFWVSGGPGVLARLSGDGELLGRTPLLGTDGAPRAGGIAALAVSPIGRLAVAGADGQIEVYTAGESAPILTLGHTVTQPEHLGSPAAVAVGPDHSVLVADGADARVKRFTSRGRLLRTWPVPVPAPQTGGDTEFTGLGVTTRREVVIADGATVYVYSIAGRLRRSFKLPAGIRRVALGPRDRIYVLEADPANTDPRAGQVGIYTTRGRLTGRVRLRGADGRPPHVTGMTVDASGGIHLSDAEQFFAPISFGRNEVTSFTPRGRLLRTIHTSDARAVAVDESGRLFVATDAAERGYGSSPTGASGIGVYATTGRRLRTIGAAGSRLGEFRNPSALAIDHVADRTVLLVADRGNHRIQRLTLNR